MTDPLGSSDASAFIKLTHGVPQESYRREKLWFYTVRRAYHAAQGHYFLLFIINDYPHWRIFQIKANAVFVLISCTYWFIEIWLTFLRKGKSSIWINWWFVSTKQTNSLNSNAHSNCSLRSISLKIIGDETCCENEWHDLPLMHLCCALRRNVPQRRECYMFTDKHQLRLEWPRGKIKAFLLHAMLAYEGVEVRSTHC